MKKIILFVALFCALLCKAQNNFLSDYISIEKQIFFSDIKTSRFSYSKSCNSNEIFILFYDIESNSDSVCFIVFDTQNDSIILENFYIEGLNESLKTNYDKGIDGFAASNKYIAILNYDFVYLLDRKTHSVINKFTNGRKNNFENVNFINNDKILLYCNYNFHKDSRKIKTQFYIFSITNFKLIKEITPNFDVIQYSHITPQHWIDIYNHKIIFSNTVNYKISIFDDKLNLSDTIYLKNYKWNTPSEDELLKIKKTESAINIIHEILKIEDHTDRISGVYYISDSTIIVNINNGIKHDTIQKTNYLFDVLKKKNGKWQLINEKIEDQALEDIKLENSEYSLFKRKYGNNLIFTENNIYLLTFLPPIKLFKDISTENYIKQSNEYLYEHEPVFQIIKYKHKFSE